MRLTIRNAILVGSITGAIFWPVLDLLHGIAKAEPSCAGASITLDGVPSAVALCRLPQCAQEDGNVDGKPCLWIDPDTQGVYYVESENYR